MAKPAIKGRDSGEPVVTTAPVVSVGAAVALHRAGRLDQAEAMYRSVLECQPDCADALHLLGVVASQRGAFDQAIELIVRALALNPGAAHYQMNLGEAYRRRGLLADAAGRYRAVLDVHPDMAAAHYGLGRLAATRGDAQRAASHYRAAIERDPTLPEPHVALGELAFAAYDYGAAATHYRAAFDRRPDDAGLAFRLGVALRASAAWPDAERAFAAALALNPELAEAHGNLADLLYRRDDCVAAAEHYRRALELAPDLAGLHNNYAILLAADGRYPAAIEHLESAVAIAPDYRDAWVNLGETLAACDRLDQARTTLEALLRRAPDHAAAHAALGGVRYRQARPAAAAAAYRRAVRLDPGDARAYDGLGTALAAIGRVDEALSALRQAVALAPDDSGIHSNLAFCTLYDATATADEIVAVHRAWGARHGAVRAAPPRPSGAAAEPERRLRVGYVSADFRTHPVGFFLSGVLAAHDRSRVEAICYSGQTRPDAMTARLRRLADGWRDTAGSSDETLAAQIAADGIDVLVDVSGHTGGNRLTVFARRPAPVQFTWAAYAYSTGMDAFDGILVDPRVAPAGAERYYSEPLRRLPQTWTCYRPPETAPEPGPPPATRRGFVTFGCFNNATKVNEGVVALWARMLKQLPGTRLYMKAHAFSDPAVRARYRALFAEHDVGGDVVGFAGASGLAGQLAAIAAVDIALDPFPYTGSTTTLECLWMGVPVVTLAGALYFQRHAVGILDHVGLAELVTETADEYRKRAIALALDVPRLIAIRETLRARLAASPVCDAAGFTGALEATYRDAWRAWCGRARGG
jgi:predicted O-linked N-acetylglucosamine transferase (SPINDLY family)